MERKTPKPHVQISPLLGLLLRILLIAGLCWLIFFKLFLVVQVSGTEMFPSIHDGDLIFAFRLQQSYDQKDVVVYKSDKHLRIGRLIAFQGDVITLSDQCSVCVNGTRQTVHLPDAALTESEIAFPYVVLKGQCFVLADHPDGRFSVVPMEDIKGKVITLLRRRNF